MAERDTKPSITVTVVGLTDVGKVREHNEDNFLVMSRSDGRQIDNGELVSCDMDSALILAVADGMGGAAAGEVASSMAVDRLAKDLGAAGFDGATPDQVVALIDQTLQQANGEIRQEGKDNPDRRGMGTTMTAAVIKGDRAYLAQVGDSRGYLFRKNKLIRLTRDQSLIEQLIEEGTITVEEAEKMGGHNIILQALGVEDTVRPDTSPCVILRGDVFLLCSDGLSGMITDDDMEKILLEVGTDLKSGVKKLVAAANEGGGRDNITVVLARFEGEGLRPPMETDTTVAKVGHQFKAPPPPEMPNPMKKIGAAGAVILAILVALLFALRKTTADVTIPVSTYRPVPVTVVLKSLDGGDSQTLATDGKVDGEQVVFEDLAPGKYLIEATAPDHYPVSQPIEIKDPGAKTADPVALSPLKGAVVVRSKEKNVLVVVIPEGGRSTSDGYQERFGAEDVGQSWTIDKVVPGQVTIRTSRPGFRTVEIVRTLEPGGTVEVEVATGGEMKGTVRVKCSLPGVAVEVRDADGEGLGEGATTAGTDLELVVRVGAQTLSGTLSGYTVRSQEVAVEEGKVTEATLDPKVRTVTVEIRAPAAVSIRAARIERRTPQGGWQVVEARFNVPRGSRSVLELVPGSYRLLRPNPQGGSSLDTKFEVVRGKGPVKVELE